MACKYSEIFGKPKEGIHSIRIKDIAIIDVIGTIVMSLIISCIINKSMIVILIILLLLGIILHRIFCVKTTIDKMIDKIIFGKISKESTVI